MGGNQNTMIKFNFILQQEKLQHSKIERKSSSSVSSFAILDANDLLQNIDGNDQIKPILKQSRKNNIFGKKY